MKTTSKIPAYLSGISAATIFGFSFFMTKEAITNIDMFHFIALRFTLAALLATILTLIGLVKINIKFKEIKSLLVISLFQPMAYFVFETSGIKITTSAEAGLLIALIPITTTILSALALKEYTNSKQFFFITVSIAGVALIILMQSASSLEKNILGYMLLVGAVFSATFYNILSRRSSPDFTPFEITFVMMWTGAIVFTGIALYRLGLSGNLSCYFTPLKSKDVILAILYLGSLSSLTAFFFINYALSKLPASQTSIFANLTTVIAVCAGVIIRNEPFFWYHLLGTILIIFGVWGTNYFSSRMQTPKIKELSVAAE